MMMEDDDSNSEKQDRNTSETSHSLMVDAVESNNEKPLRKGGINMTRPSPSQNNDKASIVRKHIFQNISFSFTL